MTHYHSKQAERWLGQWIYWAEFQADTKKKCISSLGRLLDKAYTEGYKKGRSEPAPPAGTREKP